MAPEHHEPYPAQRQPTERSSLGDLIVSSSGDAIMAMDRNGLVVEWNASCEELFGWTAEEMRGRTAEALMPPERRDELTRVLRALTGTVEDAALETQRLHKSGAVLPVSCRLSPMHDSNGEVIGVCAVVRDNSREMDLRRQLEQARHLAEARFEQSVIAQATLTPDGVVVDVNPALCALAGYEPKQLLGRPVTDFLAAPDVDRTASGLSRLATGELPSVQQPQLLRHGQGHVLETRVSLFAVREDPTGPVLRLEAVVEDVSAAAAANRELQLREERWQSLALHSSDVAMFCDVDAKLLFISSSVEWVFGYSPSELAEGDGWSYVHPDDVEGAKAVWAATTAAPTGTTETFELRLRHADGSWRWTEQSLTNELDNPAVAAMVVNLVDISERKSAEAVLEELAGLDTLTGLATRAPLMAALDSAFAAGLADSTAVVVVDITRLKLINHTYGHRGGDEVLTEVAARLRKQMDGRGVVARVGGDRFAAMFGDVSDVTDVFEGAAALLAAVQDPLQLGDDPLSLTATVGAALGPAVDSGALLASAEAALLTAKEGLAGPMHVVRAESASGAVSRARLIEDLRRGLDADELVVHFQPVVSLTDGRAVGAEALVRWMHPDKGLLSPGAFIDAAEESGLIIDVGQRVLREACQAAALWAGSGARPFHVAVNLSAKQLIRGGVVDVVRAALADGGAAAANLVLEVTESAVMSDVDAAVRTLQELRDLGVAIAVDDFGTGYSSLTYLKQFPVTALKIDRSFVGGLGRNNDDAAIVTSVINLARAMGLECVAEGVETEQQRLVLQALGCTVGQGFLWSPALDPSAFEMWLGGAGSGDGRSAQPAARTAAERRDERPVVPPRRPQQAAVAPEVLRRIADLQATGASMVTIAAALNADQQVTPRGKRWTATTVAQLLAAQPRGR